MDLVCLVADKSMEASARAILERPNAIGVRPFAFEVLRHPQHDPGCFHHSARILSGYSSRAEHALVLLDHEWDGVPGDPVHELEAQVVESLGPDWQHRAGAVVIAPELEAWVFTDSPHVPAALGWDVATMGDFRTALADQGFWPHGSIKPPDPKAAMDWALRKIGQPRSSAIFRDIASNVSLRRCRDESFGRFRGHLTRWFGADADPA